MSVALCTYNGERFVGEQIASIAEQDERPFELVVCDDGSTDATVPKVRQALESVGSPERWRVATVTREGGVTANFARAIGLCSGDLIALCDQDDKWRAPRLAAATAILTNPEVPHLCFSNATLIDGDGVAGQGSLFRAIQLRRAEVRQIRRGRAMRVLIRRNVVTGATATVTRSLARAAAPFPSSWLHDEWLAIIAAAIGTVTVLDGELIEYRLHATNQVGVADPGVVARARRALGARGDRYVRLAARSEDLVGRLEELGAPASALRLARAKARFEAARARYPARRLRRIVPIASQALMGRYARLSSQRNLDIFRDLFQPL